MLGHSILYTYVTVKYQVLQAHMFLRLLRSDLSNLLPFTLVILLVGTASLQEDQKFNVRTISCSRQAVEQPREYTAYVVGISLTIAPG